MSRSWAARWRIFNASRGGAAPRAGFPGLRGILATCISILVPLSGVVYAEPERDVFERVAFLTRAGAPQLALRILQNNQPAQDDAERWMRAEQLRLAIYRKQNDWQALRSQLEGLPAELPLMHKHRLFTQAAETLVEAGYGADARRHLRELLWYGLGDSRQISYWRRLIIRSYLREDGLDDALMAMDRYQKEYLPNDDEWTYLLGLTLIKNNADRRAAGVLTPLQSSRGRYLKLLSRLRAGIDAPDHVISQAASMYKTAAEDGLLRQRHWALMAEAAALDGDRELRVRSLERLFSVAPVEDRELPLSVGPGALWSAYGELARDTADAAGLPEADNRAWLTEAARLAGINRYRARAIHAFVADRTRDADDWEKLNDAFYTVLGKADLERLAVALYDDRVTFPLVADIPPMVRHHIVRYALKKQNIPLAARMADDLTVPYPGQDPFAWLLIRARLAIYSGVLADGERMLRELIEPADTIDASSADRIMQLVFDLQSVGGEESALRFFEMMHTRVIEENQKRETLFWIADVLESMGEHDRAAEYYLRSAVYGNEAGYDIWGKTARYHAAEALTEAKLISDARVVYQDLLDATADPKRAINLDRKLQELWLREQPRVDTAE